jgi:hypothetical protein
MKNRKGMSLVSAALVALGLPLTTSAETRQINAHQHGTTEIEMSIDAGTVAMALHAPGADIVGFEHSPESEADKAAVAAARQQ